MKKVIVLLFGFILATPFFVSAQSGGGFPSQPTFQKVKVTTGPVTINSAGSGCLLAVGSSCYAWGSNQVAIDLSNTGAIRGDTTNTGTVALDANLYFNGSSYIYKTTNFAGELDANLSSWTWRTAPSGTAGTTPTFTQQFFINQNGAVVGSATGGSCGSGCLNAQSLEVNGTAVVTSVPISQVSAFDALTSTSPSVITCNHCQGTPTIVRNSTGNYTITFQSSGSYVGSCSIRNNSVATGTVFINSYGTGAVTVLTYTSGSLSDTVGEVDCVMVGAS